MAHAQKPDFVFQGNVRVHLNRPAGASVQSTTGSRGVRISCTNAGYTMFRGSVKGTGYQLHSPVSPSLPIPCVTVCHQVSTELYHFKNLLFFICSSFRKRIRRISMPRSSEHTAYVPVTKNNKFSLRLYC